jgi:hypothetical protein
MKPFSSSFTAQELTSDQEDLVGHLDAFIHGDGSCFLLKGYAGTGKTFLMAGLTRYLHEAEIPFRLMAPTGRAAKVISAETRFPASTIHSAIYLMDNLREYKTGGIDGTETYKYYFDLTVNADDARTVYIVDEASMVSDRYSEAEFFRFGSGFLLRDLLRYVNLDANDHRKKVIFIGDAAQLPPINSNTSPALDASYLADEYELNPLDVELTEVVRHGEQSGILANASEIRDRIRKGTFNVLNIDVLPADVHELDVDQLLDTYRAARDRDGIDETIIITHTNHEAKEYNTLVRRERFPGRTHIGPDDRVLLVRNSYRNEIPLLNGDFGTVVKASATTEERTVYLNKPEEGKRVNIPVSLAFRDLVVRFVDLHGNKHDISCKVSENLLNGKEGSLSSDQCKGLYVDFKTRHDHLTPGTPEFREAIKYDPYFNCLHVKYGYAITCHKAQGGEWLNVFIDFGPNRGFSNENYFRWAYTAITRAQSQLYTLHAPRYSILTASRNTSAPRASDGEAQLGPPTGSPGPSGNFDWPADQPGLQVLFRQVARLTENATAEITHIEHKQYCEHYTLTEGAATCVAYIYYKANLVVSKVQWKPNANPALQEKLAGPLSQLEGMRLETPVCPQHPDVEITYPVDAPYLKEFHQAIEPAAKELDIRISRVEHPSMYHAKYGFTREGAAVEINYYFNRTGRLTTSDPVRSQGTSAALLEQVIALTPGPGGK